MAVATATALAIGTIAATAGTAGAQAYGAHRASDAAEQGAQLQTDSANRSALLQARANRQQLDFLRSQDAQDRASYAEEQTYNRQQAAEALARQEPFRQFRLGALRQLSTPMVQNRPPGSLPPAGTLGGLR